VKIASIPSGGGPRLLVRSLFVEGSSLMCRCSSAQPRRSPNTAGQVLAATFFGLLLAALPATTAVAQQFPFGKQNQPYRAGTLSPTNFTRAQQNAHVAAYYDLFKSRWIAVDPGGHGWRVKLDPSGDTVSEGQGYGMVIVAAMAGQDPQAKTIFDGLWTYRKAHPSEIDSRLMDWKQPDTDGNDSAFDGDADIAYGLLMAHAQWGSGGTINYLNEAKTVIAGIKASTIGPQSKLPLLGDWVNPNSTDMGQWDTRSSDFMPGHFRAYGAATNDAAYWSGVVTAVQNVTTNIQANESAVSGLLPDFIRLKGASRDPQPAEPDFFEGKDNGHHDGDYWYNAGRVPWRLGADAVLNNDTVTLAQVKKISTWIRTSTSGNPNNIGAGYKLNGVALHTDWQDHFFISPFAVAAMTGSGVADQQWLNALYSRVYREHGEDNDPDPNYYSDAVTLQSLLVVTGNFWDPMYVLAHPPKPGDFDGDGTVGAADLLKWRQSVGVNAGADADGDGDSDGADFLAWQRNLGGAAIQPQANPAPEPCSAAMVLLAIAAHALGFRGTARLLEPAHRI
jgi:endo-1,4-beta-D-glucanase Y